EFDPAAVFVVAMKPRRWTGMSLPMWKVPLLTAGWSTCVVFMLWCFLVMVWVCSRSMRCLTSGQGRPSGGGERLLAGGKNAEYLVEPGPFKEATEIVTDSKEDKIASVGFDPLHGLEQGRDAAAIDVVHLVQVDE